MSSEAKAEKKPKSKPEGAPAAPAGEKKSKAAKAETAAAAPAAEPAKPRPPADPRLKVLKKFHGRFLPRGVLRDRHRAIMVRWDSGEDHGGVTVDELKTLLDDWRGTREKPPRKPKA